MLRCFPVRFKVASSRPDSSNTKLATLLWRSVESRCHLSSKARQYGNDLQVKRRKTFHLSWTT